MSKVPQPVNDWERIKECVQVAALFTVAGIIFISLCMLWLGAGVPYYN